MEDSIKKAEELIQATNTALARIQSDASVDDFGSILEGIKYMDERKISVLDDVKRVLSPREKIFEMTDPFSLNKNSFGNDKIEEIEYKIAADRLERESAMGFDVPVTRTTSDTNLSQRTVTKINLVDDLKAKLQATQEVVNRGIQTARELSETVEVLRCKTERREMSSPHKSESVCTVRTTETKRCKRCNAEITRKTAKQKERRKEGNVLVTRVTGMDSSIPRRRRNLNYQQLPSLRIQGDLRCQRIPSVDIPPGKRECFPQRANAAYEMYSHEEIVSDKVDKIIEEIKTSNGFVLSGKSNRMKSVECSNCGKAVRMSDKSVRTEQIDELLKMCDYNVFDPRIDEFVERFNGRIPEEAKYTQTETLQPVEVPTEENPKRRMRISDLRSEITRKYRENATELESDHLEFEGILRELFEKMDESRSVLKKCNYLNAVAGKRKSSLSVTPPVLLSYTGSGEEADDGRNAVLRPSRLQKSKLPSRLIRKKLERKELEVNCKLISSSCPSAIHPVKTPQPVKPAPIVKLDVETPLPDESCPDVVHPIKTFQPVKPSPIVKLGVETPLPDEKPSKINSRPTAKQLSPVNTTAEWPPSHKPEVNQEESVKRTNTVSDYESDFEEESIQEKSPEPQADDNSNKYNTRLSTISEVESELDRKMSDLAITSEEINRVEDKSKRTSSSSDEDDTKKLLRKVNRDLKEVESQQLLSTKCSQTLKKVPENVAEPLKEVLNALKNQFERTELLADKLTESIKEVKKPEEGQEIALLNGHRDFIMVNNLQRARKIAENGSVSYARSNLLRTLSEKSAREKEIPTSPTGSVSSKGSDSSGKSYSEGEISEQEALPSQRSSPSIGEVINEYSDGSLSEEKSVIKFL